MDTNIPNAITLSLLDEALLIVAIGNKNKYISNYDNTFSNLY